jgi:hypothetical protein
VEFVFVGDLFSFCPLKYEHIYKLAVESLGCGLNIHQQVGSLSIQEGQSTALFEAIWNPLTLEE